MRSACGKVNIGEIAHADGEVDGGAAVGDFDLAPGSVHVEEDEQVGRAIALVLAVVAFELARLGRDRLPHLADELGRALVETDDRALRIGRFGVEVEHILHAGDVFAVDLRNAPHVLAPRLELVFRQAPPHRLAREAVVLGEPDQFPGQQFERPTSAARGRVRTGGRDQQRFLFARELAARSRARLFAQRRLQVAEHEAPLGPVDGRARRPRRCLRSRSSLAPASAASKICTGLWTVV